MIDNNLFGWKTLIKNKEKKCKKKEKGYHQKRKEKIDKEQQEHKEFGKCEVLVDWSSSACWKEKEEL